MVNVLSITFKSAQDIQRILDRPLAETMNDPNPRFLLIIQALWAAKLAGTTFSEAEVIFYQLGTSRVAYSHTKNRSCGDHF